MCRSRLASPGQTSTSARLHPPLTPADPAIVVRPNNTTSSTTATTPSITITIITMTTDTPSSTGRGSLLALQNY